MNGVNRGRRVAWAVATGFAGKGMVALTMMITTPMSIRYLGVEGFGILTTITSVVAWMLIANVGVGLGLQNSLTEAISRGDAAKARELVSTAFAMVGGLTLAMVLVAAAVFHHVDWVSLFGAHGTKYEKDIPALVAISGTGVAATMIYSVYSAIFSAKQELHALNLIGGVCQLIVMVAVVVAIRLDAGIKAVALANVGGLCFSALAISSAYLFLRKSDVHLFPSFRHVRRSAFSRVVGSAKYFFILQVCCILLFEMNLFIINKCVGPAEVTPYYVGQRIFLILTSLFSLALAPMWPAYGHAASQRDFGWIRAAHLKIIRLLAVFLVLSGAGLLVFGKLFFKLWVGSEAAPGGVLLALLFVYFAVKQWTDVHSILINGLDKMRQQAASASIHAVITVALSWWWARLWGSPGLVAGGIVGYVCVSAWFLPVLAKKNLSMLESRP